MIPPSTSLTLAPSHTTMVDGLMDGHHSAKYVLIETIKFLLVELCFVSLSEMGSIKYNLKVYFEEDGQMINQDEGGV